MSESLSPIQPEWTRDLMGGLIRERTGKFGEKITEVRFPDTYHEITSRTFKDAWRDSEVLKGKMLMDRIRLAKGDVLTDTTMDREGLDVYLKDSSDKENRIDDQLIHLFYDSSGLLQSLRAQAELPLWTSHGYNSLLGERQEKGPHPTYQQLLSIDLFSENGFTWSELERTSFIGPRENEEHIVRGETSRYGENIAIQDHRFLVTRNGNKITIRCSYINGKPRWTATVPLSVPIERIKGVFDDTESDFRVLKDLIPASLKIGQ